MNEIVTMFGIRRYYFPDSYDKWGTIDVLPVDTIEQSGYLGH